MVLLAGLQRSASRWETQGPRGVPDPAKLTLPPHLPDLPGVRSDLARYIAEVEHLDGDVQDVLDMLEERGLADNTLVVFMGDNGMAMPHGKGALDDPGIAVPLLVRWPGVVKPGAVTRTLVSGEDFAPTMLEAAGIAPPKEMSGVSYLKLLRGEPFKGRKYIFAERGPHGGDGGMKPDILASTFDLARCVRSRTSSSSTIARRTRRSRRWTASAIPAGRRCRPRRPRASSPRSCRPTSPRRADLRALRPRRRSRRAHNLAGDPKYAQVERGLKEALTEKMVLDWDFLPTPLR